MRKIQGFLHIFVSLTVLLGVAPAWSAGYDCPSTKQYTSCNEDYYMNNSGPGNACVACSSVSDFSKNESCTRSCTIANGTCSYSGSTSNNTYHYVGNGQKTTSTGIAAGCKEEKKVTGTCTGGTISITCNASFYLSGETCASCAVGTYSGSGATSCAACTNKPENSYYTSNGTTATGCAWECNSGYHLEGAACVLNCNTAQTCPDGYSNDNGGIYNECTTTASDACYMSCTAKCAGNATCPEHATSCNHDTTHTLTGTQYYNRSCSVTAPQCPMTEVTACETGYQISSDKKSCELINITCPAGQYLPRAQLSCAACPAGSYCPGTGSTPWNYNAVADQGRDTCTKDHYCPAQSAEPTACPSGYPYTETGGQSAVTSCYSNTKQRPWTENYQQCTRPEHCSRVQCGASPLPACDYVAYADETGTADGIIKTGCEFNNDPVLMTIDPNSLEADLGYFVEKDKLTCTICPDGQTCLGGTEPPIECPAGKVCKGGTTLECPAGSYCPTGSTDPTECPAGSYCPAGSTDPVACPDNSYCPVGSGKPTSCPTDGDGSIDPRDSVTNCYQLCDLTTADIDNSSSVTAASDRVFATGTGTYPICQYDLECKRGYSEEIDPDTKLPYCMNTSRQVILDDQNPTTPAGIKVAYLFVGSGWFADEEMTVSIFDIKTLPTKTGYVFDGYYTQTKGAGQQVVGADGEFLVTRIDGNGLKIYANWLPGVTICPAGQYYATGKGCQPCTKNNYCLGGEFVTDGGNQGLSSCADIDDGHWAESFGGSTMEECFQTCQKLMVVGGTANPVNAFEFWPGECTYTGTSDSGNPCDIIDGVCIETACKPSYELIGNECVPCDREFAMEYMPNANCKITNCIAGYHPNTGGLACEPDEIECDAPNAVDAKRVWDNKRGVYSTCVATGCDSGYHVADGACVTDEQSCTVEHGIGVREWDDRANTWGKCIAVYCDPGYTDIASESDEPNAPCGRCKNYYSVLGEPAASSYVRGCELASCLYSGEKYILDGNECRPICEEHSDETGTMKWNPSSKKCERICKPGYMAW